MPRLVIWRWLLLVLAAAAIAACTRTVILTKMDGGFDPDSPLAFPDGGPITQDAFVPDDGGGVLPDAFTLD